jgi:hypothetical protein
MKSKIRISLAGYARPESDLETLKNVVPNGDFHYFGDNPITHNPKFRRTNDQLNPPEKDENINIETSPKKKETKRKRAKAFGTPSSGSGPAKHKLPSEDNRYFGLRPIEHFPTMKISPHPSMSSNKIKIKIDL